MLLFSTESAKTVGLVFLLVFSMCKANIQTAEAKGIGGTVVATSYLTLHSYSKSNVFRSVLMKKDKTDENGRIQ